jgi:hypothetical protein
MVFSEELQAKAVQAVIDAGLFTADGKGAGWKGGSLWIVPTFKPIEEWVPIATRDF